MSDEVELGEILGEIKDEEIPGILRSAAKCSRLTLTEHNAILLAAEELERLRAEIVGLESVLHVVNASLTEDDRAAVLGVLRVFQEAAERTVQSVRINDLKGQVEQLRQERDRLAETIEQLSRVPATLVIEGHRKAANPDGNERSSLEGDPIAARVVSLFEGTGNEGRSDAR